MGDGVCLPRQPVHLVFISFFDILSCRGNRVHKGRMKAVDTIARRELPSLLGNWLGEAIRVEHAVDGDGRKFDLVVHAGDTVFAFGVNARDDVAVLERAHQHLRDDASLDPGAVRVLVVPYMGPKAKAWVDERGLSWLDLSGNANIRGPRLRILIEGQPNRFATPGRPSTAFSDKAARLTRAMLAGPEKWWRQRELAEVTGLSAGYVSKVVTRLREDGLVDDDLGAGMLRPRSPDVLLDAWAQVYDFRRHDIARYHAVGRTGPAVTEALAERLAAQRDVRWAATGLAAAWRLGRFADHRLVSFYVSEPPADIDALGLRPVDRGENVWLVVPRDEGVFSGAVTAVGLRCVHPVQVWLDLLGHPERASEAAKDLREHHLPWKRP